LHVGSTIKRDFVQSLVPPINDLEPDLIVLTGDLMDGSVTHLRYDVAPLRYLKSRYGNYFVTGNHEYYSGLNQWLREIHHLGFALLINEHRMIQHANSRIILGGVTDYSQKRGSHASDPVASIKHAPTADIKILLAHQPLSVYKASAAGYDLQISGHTHGGQYFPWSELVALRQPFVSGLYRHENSWVYVSDGTGYWGPPLRIGTQSEITLIQLVDSKSPKKIKI
jgi:predicted MPP superfamily phosphohydrolase